MKMRLKPLPCTDSTAVEAVRRMDHWRHHEPFDYPTFNGSVSAEMPTVLARLLLTDHPYYQEAYDLVHWYTDVVDMPMECFDRLCRLIHFEYTTDDGEEAHL